MPGPGAAAATPIDSVTVSVADLPIATGTLRTACSTRPATFSPSVIAASVSTRANSSPPKRAPVSLMRISASIRCATSRSTASPARCPYWSLMRLK